MLGQFVTNVSDSVILRADGGNVDSQCSLVQFFALVKDLLAGTDIAQGMQNPAWSTNTYTSVAKSKVSGGSASQYT